MRCLCPGASGCLYWAGCPQDMAGPHGQQGPVTCLLAGAHVSSAGKTCSLALFTRQLPPTATRTPGQLPGSRTAQPCSPGSQDSTGLGPGPLPASAGRCVYCLPLAALSHRTQVTQFGGGLGPSASMAGSRKAVIRCLRAQPLPQALYCEPWTLGAKGTMSTVQQTCPSVSLWGPLETNTVDGFLSVNKLHSQN